VNARWQEWLAYEASVLQESDIGQIECIEDEYFDYFYRTSVTFWPENLDFIGQSRNSKLWRPFSKQFEKKKAFHPQNFIPLVGMEKK